MEQCTDRRGGHHGSGQPPVYRHQGRLADTEGVQPQQQPHRRAGNVALQNATRGKGQCPGHGLGPEDGRQQQPDGSAHQDAQINPGRLDGLFIALVGNQGIGGDGQDLVAQEQGKQVLREGDAHGGSQGNGEAHVEPGLVAFIIAPHVTNGIHGVDDPQQGGQSCKQHAQGLHLEGDVHAVHHRPQVQGGPLPIHH